MPETTIPVLCLIGGKWTTFRGFSEQAADAVLRHLGAVRKVSTAGVPIGGGLGMPRTAQGRDTLAADLAVQSKLGPARVAILLSRFETRARDYLATLNDEDETPLRGCAEYSVQEIRHICRTERATTVDDVLRRRTLITLTGQDSTEVREQVRAILVSVLQAPVMS